MCLDSPILNVLIVDDELPIREELRSFDWRSHGACLIGECDNGSDALEFCCNNFPDVVISDIEMPMMDGLSLFQHLKIIAPATQLVVLTCHKDFEYVSQALHLGALDYIVKVNMQDSHLAEVLDKARTLIQSNRRVDFDKKRLRRNSISRIFRKFRSQEYNLAQLQQQLAALGVLLKGPTYLPLIFFNTSSQDSESVLFEIQEYFAECDIFSKEGYDGWFPLSSSCILLWPDDARNCSSECIKEKLGRIMTNIQKILNEHFPYLTTEVRTHGIIGKPISTVGQFPEYFSSLHQWEEFPFYFPNNNLFVEPFPHFYPIPNHQWMEMWERGLQLRQNRTRLCHFIDSTFAEWVRKGSFEPIMVRRFCNLWLAELLLSKQDVLLVSKINHELDSAFTFDELIDRILFWLNNKNRTMLHPEMRCALVYIDGHLGNTVTLSTVAEEIGLSPQYLSRLFHQEVGQPFNQYLTEKRIEKAMYYLNNSNLRVYEIAEKVGLPNYRYFSNVFKKRTGVTPVEYRKGINI